MLQIHCSGTPYEIGIQHGRHAYAEIARGLEFYKAYFVEKSGLEWEQARAVAGEFLRRLESKTEAAVEVDAAIGGREMVEEMRGIAAGATEAGGVEVTFEDILALNVRSEIAMGLMNDGCTALSWKSPMTSTSILAQNWDWDPRQQHSLICITISTPGKPTIVQITEAGILGKIGFNSAGLGVCLNAIRCKGVDYNKLPVHLALRFLLNSTSKDDAIATLEKVGLASACHILVADEKSGGTGLEWSYVDGVRIEGRDGVVTHTNHFLKEHRDGIKETISSEDSRQRIVRINQLMEGACFVDGEEKMREADGAEVERMLKDEQDLPGAINRKAEGISENATLFSIVVNLGMKKAKVKVGRPTEYVETFEIGLPAKL